MHGLILVNAYAKTLRTGQVMRMSEELDKLGVRTDVMRNNGFFAHIDGGNSAIDLNYDFCLYLDKDKYVSRILEKHMRLFNSAAAIEACDDKMTTHIMLANSGIAMPATVPGLLCYDSSAPVDEAAILRVEKLLGLPLVVKQSFGSLGAGVFLADTHDRLLSLAARFKTEPHLFQQYIKSSHGKDMRVIVVGGKVLGGMLRSSPTDFRSNIGLGGTAERCDVPNDIAKSAVSAAEILGLDYCGIDFLLGDTPLLCEVNSNAFFDAFESATNINVAAAYAKHIVESMQSR